MLEELIGCSFIHYKYMLSIFIEYAVKTLALRFGVALWHSSVFIQSKVNLVGWLLRSNKYSIIVIWLFITLSCVLCLMLVLCIISFCFLLVCFYSWSMKSIISAKFFIFVIRFHPSRRHPGSMSLVKISISLVVIQTFTPYQ